MPGRGSLGGVPFLIDPRSAQWDFGMKLAEKKTVGGKVVQVYGTRLGDMVVSGNFGRGDRAAGDEAGWEYQERFLGQVKRWAHQSEQGGPPLHFMFPPRGWDFHVVLKGFRGRGGSSITHSNTEFNPQWNLIFGIVSDNTGIVVRATMDIYIQRLMDGVGWKQSKYNGPKQSDVDDMFTQAGVDPGNITGFMAQQFGEHTTAEAPSGQ